MADKLNEINQYDLDELTIRYGDASIKEIEYALQHSPLKDWQIPILQARLYYKKEEAKNKPTLMYHRRKAPTGKSFKACEITDLEKKGWVDSPDKFEKTFWQKLHKIPNPTTEPASNKPPDKKEQKEWYQRPIGIVGLTIFAGVILALAIYLIKKHLGIPLN